MKSNNKIDRLAELADMRQRDLAQALARAVRKQDDHCGKIEELKRYRHDYAVPLSDGSLNGANAQQIVAFITNLDSLIRNLETQRPALTAAVQDAEREWLASQHKAKSFNKLAQKALLKKQQILESRQERSLDDAWLAQNFSKT